MNSQNKLFRFGGWPTFPARVRKFEGGPLLALFEKWGFPQRWQRNPQSFLDWFSSPRPQI